MPKPGWPECTPRAGVHEQGAKLLFQIFTEREERKALTFRCTLIQTGTESYRFQATQETLFTTPK